GTEAEPDLDSGEADFRITYGSQAERHARRILLYTDWLVPACTPARLQGQPGLSPAQVLQGPLIHVEWEKVYQSPPGWAEWAHALGLAVTPCTHSLRFSLSGNAIDAALAGRGIVLAPASMLDADLKSGRLVVPYHHRLPLPESYFLSWSKTALSKPFAGELMHWLRAAALKQNGHAGLPSPGQAPEAAGPPPSA
ncbi:MAG: LysR substrate-binding domain-containing protein, partial [Comamonadaceae bacterium]|nr:LysR substrate-binding domain-containing protein [Comamonadaceae bacterium]